jgi:hypothetical protein
MEHRYVAAAGIVLALASLALVGDGCDTGRIERRLTTVAPDTAEEIESERSERAHIVEPGDAPRSGIDPEPTVETTPASNVGMSPLAARYPSIASRVVVDGVPLSEIDLATLPVEKFFDSIHQVRLLALDIERDLIATLHGVEEQALDREAARELYEARPSTYVAKLPGVVGSQGRGPSRYVDLTGVLPQELLEARELAMELSGHPRLQSYQIDEYQRLANTPRTDGAPGMQRPAVARWEPQRFGQILVGYDAAGRMVAQIRGNWIGVPEY